MSTEVMTIQDVRCYVDANGTAYLDAEAVARGLGFTMVRKDRVTTSGDNYEAVRWERVNGYLKEFGFPHAVGKGDFIPENMFYRLAMKANNAAAQKFQAKVADEILPSIRKTGAYITPQASTSPQAMITLLRNAADTIEKLQAQVAELKPHAEYCRWILRSPDAIPVTLIAKDYGMSAEKFNELLHKIGVQYKVDKTWVLYTQYTGKGYTASRTTLLGEFKSVVHTYWTQKGRLFLYEKLKKNGTLPICEQAHQIALPL